jgi:ferric enterobactin receptor
MLFTRKFTLLLLGALIFSLNGLLAQDAEQALIRGTVLESETSEPLGFANVSVVIAGTDSLISGGTTNFEGQFEIPVPIGVYDVKINFLSYQAAIIEKVAVTDEQPTQNLGAVNLVPDAQVIDEVEVVAEKSQLQIGLDKRVFNVGQDLSRTGGSAADLLDNIPSVAVDQDGNVSLRGSQGVRILVNGRPSGLVGLGDTQGLQLMQSNMIDRVEIITNPSAKYEAEGTVGIINIILKKERREGLNGAFDVNTGIPHNHGVGVNLNLRKNFFNLFGNFGVRYRERTGGGETFQQFTRADTTFFTNLDRDNRRTDLGGRMQIGADFFLNPTNILTTSFMYRKGRDKSFNETVYRDYDDNFLLSEITERIDEEGENEQSLEYSLNYEKKFKKEEQRLTASVRYESDNEVESSDIIEQLVNENREPIGSDPLFQRSVNDEKQSELLLQADYVHPFGKEGKIEAGFRSSFRKINNDYTVEEQNNAGEWELLTRFSNDFDYDENIHAVYGTIGNKFGRISLQGGLRAELSDIRTALRETNEVNDRSYLNLFPSVFVGYEFPADQTVQVSYSRRIRRPRFWYLNPFFSFSDNRNIRSGNPNLNPEFSDSYEITYIKYWGNTSVTGSAYYRHTTDVMDRITTVLNDSTTLSQPQNLLERDDYGLEAIVSTEIDKWWRLNGSFNFFRAITDGGDLGEEYSADTYSWTGRINSRMKLWKKLDLQLMFNYRGPENRPQGKRKALAYLDAGLSLDIFGGNGTLDLNLRDVFNSRRYRFITDIPGLYSEGNFRWRRQQSVTIGLTYRLNQQKRRGDRGDRGGDFENGDMEF